MRWRNRLVLAALGCLCALALLAYLVGLNAIGNLVQGIDVSGELRRVVREEHQPRVAIADLTKFEWDELYLYSGYDFNEDICARLSMTSWECANLPPETDQDGGQKMVFLFHGRVVHSEEGSIYDGDFEQAPSRPLTPATAVFAVEQDGTFGNGDPRYVLRGVPAAVRP